MAKCHRGYDDMDIKDMDINDVCKMVPCAICLGAGSVTRYPHYSIPMPEKREEGCQSCGGHGVKILIAIGVECARDSSFVRGVNRRCKYVV